MVANSKLCGKWPSEKPCSPSSRSACGPVTPAPRSASPEMSSRRHQLVEPAQVQRDDGVESAAVGVEAADHAGAAAERHHRDPPLRAVPQHLGDLVLGARSQDRVGRVLRFSVLAAQQVQGGLAAGAQQSRAVVVGAVRFADDRRPARRGPSATTPTDAAAPRRGSPPGRRNRRRRAPAAAAPDALGERFGGRRVAPGIPLHGG